MSFRRDGPRYALAAPDCPLSDRELDVLRLAALGLPAAAIARRAGLTAGTVRNYLSAAQAKLGVRNRAEAVALAERHGWL
ncbi:response regulator transcription factor [Actinomadura sp. NTSP31]